MRVNWTSIHALRIVKAAESSDETIVWIGVELEALRFNEGSAVTHQCRTLVDRYGTKDYRIKIRGFRVTRQAGNRLLDPVPLSDPTFTSRPIHRDARYPDLR